MLAQVRCRRLLTYLERRRFDAISPERKLLLEGNLHGLMGL